MWIIFEGARTIFVPFFAWTVIRLPILTMVPFLIWNIFGFLIWTKSPILNSLVVWALGDSKVWFSVMLSCSSRRSSSSSSLCRCLSWATISLISCCLLFSNNFVFCSSFYEMLDSNNYSPYYRLIVISRWIILSTESLISIFLCVYIELI